MVRLRKVGLAGSAVIVLVVASAPAMSQTAPAHVDSQVAPTHADDVSDDIIVTAQKRTESAQDVPISLTVISAAALERSNYNEFNDIQRFSPGLVITDSSNSRATGVTIRGIGTSTFSDAIEQSVGIVIDGVVIGRVPGAISDLVDVERVEVLRGPQGTLFGKNASAGVISIVTRQPTNTFEALGSISYATLDEIKLFGAVSGPIVADKVLARISGYRNTRDGLITNVRTGQDLNNRNEYGFRGKLLLKPVETLDITLAGDYSRRDQRCCTWTTRDITPGNFIGAIQRGVGVVAGPQNNQVNLGGDQAFKGADTPDAYQRSTIWGVSGEANLDLGAVSLTSITAFRKWNGQDDLDADQTPLPLLVFNRGTTRQRQFTQELRLTSPADQFISYVVGGFYFKQHMVTELYRTGTLGVALPAGTFFGFSNFITTDLENYAAFGQANVNLSRNFRLIAGGRYTHERQDLLFTRDRIPGLLAYPGGGPLAVPITDRISDDAFSWRLGAQYDLNRNAMVFATVTRGYKGGGFNALPDITTSRRVRPEVPTNYEVGIKAVVLDPTLTVNATLFQTDFRDFQAQALIPATTPGGLGVLDVTNAGSLRTRGFELDLTARPTKALTFTTNFAYIDATYGSFRNASCFPGQTAAQGCVTANGVATQDLTGRELNNAPKYTINVSANYDIKLPTLPFNAFAFVSYYYRSEVNYAQSLYAKTRAEGYGLLNGTLGIRSKDERFTLSVFGKNLLDTKFVGSIFSTPFDGRGTSQFPVYEARRIVGVKLDTRF